MVVIDAPIELARADAALAPAAIELDGVGHTFRGQSGPVRALAPVDLTIGSGAFVAILGPSGCGKTTLLRILSGLLECSEGRVRLAGEPPRAARRRRAIGWLAQEDGLLPWRTVRDNVGLPLQLARAARFSFPAPWFDGAADKDVQLELEMLGRVGLELSAQRYPHELSGGMRQRVALARALVARPPFLLLDEPFAHLDEITRERLGELLLELRAESSRGADAPRPGGGAARPDGGAARPDGGAARPDGGAARPGEALGRGAPRRDAAPPTTVLVTHSVLEAVRLADRVVVLSPAPGRVLADVEIDLAHPRHEDSPGFGGLVRRLKACLQQSFTKI